MYFLKKSLYVWPWSFSYGLVFGVEVWSAAIQMCDIGSGKDGDDDSMLVDSARAVCGS